MFCCLILLVRVLVMFVVLVLLVGCFMLLLYFRLIKFDFVLSVGEWVNFDFNGWLLLVVVWLFELKYLVVFENVDFFSFYECFKEILDFDLVISEELELCFGEWVEFKFSVGEGSCYVGVFVVYCDFGEVSWCYVVLVMVKELIWVELKLGQKGILNVGELFGKVGDV